MPIVQLNSKEDKNPPKNTSRYSNMDQSAHRKQTKTLGFSCVKYVLIQANLLVL